eukprot:CAMPEP_0114677936 /NCGR_PEP_ID=MMETSP0191-20121206/51109_1 /TAXON_ID=126664 /ORGANISM="Sorites sp." /LENGTH=45 /DNA_ID= /DNA_START= /DNA_END= /DNA_ORIENTATION=
MTHVFGSQGRSQGAVTTCERLPNAHDVWHHLCPLRGEELPSATEA